MAPFPFPTLSWCQSLCQFGRRGRVGLCFSLLIIIIFTLITSFFSYSLFSSSSSSSSESSTLSSSPFRPNAQWHDDGVTSGVPVPVVVISLACSSDRFEYELPITIRSLLAQSLLPSAIHVYIPKGEDQTLFTQLLTQTQTQTKTGAQQPAHPFHSPLIKFFYVDDIGPATKFLYVLAEHVHPRSVDTIIVICDNDHYYPASWLSTLLSYHEEFPFASLGYRGWRVRPDHVWGVDPAQAPYHIIWSHRISSPYQVSVCTANEGYLLHSEWFKQNHSIFRLFSRELLETNPAYAHIRLPAPAEFVPVPPLARYVDDIYMAGHLAGLGIVRLIIPSPDIHIDVTRSHTLEQKMASVATSRSEANTVAMRYFGSAWDKEIALFYKYVQNEELFWHDGQSRHIRPWYDLTRWRMECTKLWNMWWTLQWN